MRFFVELLPQNLLNEGTGLIIFIPRYDHFIFDFFFLPGDLGRGIVNFTSLGILIMGTYPFEGTRLLDTLFDDTLFEGTRLLDTLFDDTLFEGTRLLD